MRLFADAAAKRENRTRVNFLGDVRSAVWAEVEKFKELMKGLQGE